MDASSQADASSLGWRGAYPREQIREHRAPMLLLCSGWTRTRTARAHARACCMNAVRRLAATCPTPRYATRNRGRLILRFNLAPIQLHCGFWPFRLWRVCCFAQPALCSVLDPCESILISASVSLPSPSESIEAKRASALLPV